ncbi:hypothetical protein SUDANB105_07645 [Streptomyces sp. enrichment culture]
MTHPRRPRLRFAVCAGEDPADHECYATPPPRKRRSRLLRLLDSLESEPRADAVIDAVRKRVRALPHGDGRDLPHGRWLWHPVRPLMVQVPVGGWLSAAVLDMCPGRSREAGLLVGVGLASAAPAALAGWVDTGWVDWAELHRRQQRVGLVHALAKLGGRRPVRRLAHLPHQGTRRSRPGLRLPGGRRTSSRRAGAGSGPWRTSRPTGRFGAAWTTSRSWSSGKPEALDVAVGDPGVEGRLGCGGRAADVPAVREPEDAAVPGALDASVADRALGERPGEVLGRADAARGRRGIAAHGNGSTRTRQLTAADQGKGCTRRHRARTPGTPSESWPPAPSAEASGWPPP